MGDFEIIRPSDKQRGRGVWVQVTDTNEAEVYNRQIDQGKFSFIADSNGEFVTCFNNKDPFEATVSFIPSTGVEARDFSQVAKQKNLKPLEVQLAKIEELIIEAEQTLKEAQAFEERV